MGKKEENFGFFIKRHKEIAGAYEDFGKLLHTQGGPLDEKTRWLIKIGISTAGGHELALRTHMQKAVRAGCSPEEIEHAILLTSSTAGFPVMMSGLMIFREVFEKEFQ
jgi:4-carboxymuconolactone decarboxylase